MYAALAELDGDRFIARSDHAGVQALGFVQSANRTDDVSWKTIQQQTWHVVVNNVDMGLDGNKSVRLVWPIDGGQDVISIKSTRLFWSGPKHGGAPTIEKRDLAPRALPLQLSLTPGELSILTVTTTGAGIPKRTAIDERTYYSRQILQPMASSLATAKPYIFESGTSGTTEQAPVRPTKVRVSFGGGADSMADAHSSFAKGASEMGVVVAGHPCAINPSKQIGGQLHVGKDFSFLSAIEVDVPPMMWDGRALQVVIWSAAARNSSVVSSVVLVGEVPVAIDGNPPPHPSFLP